MAETILPPIRCVSCGKVLYQKWKEYHALLSAGLTSEEALNKVDLPRLCCRISLISPVMLPPGPIINPLSTTTDYIVESQARRANINDILGIKQSSVSESVNISSTKPVSLPGLPPSAPKKISIPTKVVIPKLAKK